MRSASALFLIANLAFLVNLPVLENYDTVSVSGKNFHRKFKSDRRAIRNRGSRFGAVLGKASAHDSITDTGTSIAPLDRR